MSAEWPTDEIHYVVGRDRVKTPLWAGAGTFPIAWGTRHHEYCPFGPLADAHVVTVSRDQAECLPAFSTYAEASALASELRPPFDLTYLSLDSSRVWDRWEVGDGRRHFEEGETLRYVGVLLGGDASSGIPGLHRVFPLVRMPAGNLLWIGWCRSPSGGESPGWRTVLNPHFEERLRHVSHLFDSATDEDPVETAKTAVADAADLCTAVLWFLDSANVELAEASPSRQERRAIERKGGRVAMTVQVRQRKVRPASQSSGNRIEFNHRFEVRGHYKHVTHGPHAKPDKLKPCPRCGVCRREWVPPHVKGPEDKPLIPKVRALEPSA